MLPFSIAGNSRNIFVPNHNMAGYEIDPFFSTALKLLHSNGKDSADQIKHLLEDLIEQKYGGTKSLNLKTSSLLMEESGGKSFESQKNARPTKCSSPVQATCVGQPSEKSSRDSTPLSEPISSRTSPDVDDGDLALEIFEDDLNCTVCKGMSVGARNRLVECSDCHLLYHQECHKPPISENDINDPRVVWYCSDCTKKTQEKVQPKIKASHTTESLSQKKCKSESSSEKSSLFKRSEKSSSSSSANNHGKNSGAGLGHLAAALQAPKNSGSSTSTVSSSSKHLPSSSTTGSSCNSNSNSNKSSASLSYSKTPGSPNPKPQTGSVPAPANIIAADKRLQNMKKKAAAKMQEKRSKPK